MAEVNMNSRGGRGNRKGKPTKMNLRVDFTPMVDMNMLLITFFMFCTTLSIPQVMDVVMPTKETTATPMEASHLKTITLLLGANNKVYYYNGFADYENAESLKVTDYSSSGLRNVLLDKNSKLVAKSKELKQKRRNKEISERDFKAEMANLKKSKESIIAIIKPSDKSSYKNLVDALDEMQVCNVGIYSIVDMEAGDKYLLKNYKPQLIAQVK